MAKDGHIYKRGDIYWIKYYRDGKPYYESSKSTKEAEAKRLLRKRLGQIAEGAFFGLQPEKVRFEALAEDFLNDYRINGKRSLDKAERSVKHLQGFFRGMRAMDITTDQGTSLCQSTTGTRLRQCGDQSRVGCPQAHVQSRPPAEPA